MPLDETVVRGGKKERIQECLLDAEEAASSNLVRLSIKRHVFPPRKACIFLSSREWYYREKACCHRQTNRNLTLLIKKEKMSKKLLCIKLIHTIIWAFFVLVIFYILLAGILDKINVYTFIAIGLVVAEGLILLLFGWRCPLTVVGEKYTDDYEIGFDIFLPKWMAKNNKVIFGTLFGIGVVIVILRLLDIF
jgi:hypothetical protein